jgi:hypothetical protein
MVMPTHKETYEYCEELIEWELCKVLDTAHPSKKNETLLKIKELHKHLENIQKMKTSYLSGR